MSEHSTISDYRLYVAHEVYSYSTEITVSQDTHDVYMLHTDPGSRCVPA